MENAEKVYYRINDWDRYFETAKSRSIDHKSWGAYPLKHGSGYCRMMTKKNGSAVYGAFIAMTSIIHQKPKETRQGYLTDTGGIPGYPYDDLDISAMTRIDLIIIKMAIKELLLVHWLTPCDSSGKALEGYREDTTRIPRVPYTEKRGEEKRREERKEVRFSPPTIQEVQAYIKEKGYNVNADSFVAHYESIGWKVGKNKMKSWKAAVTGWHIRSNDKVSSKPEKKDTGFEITVRFSDRRPPEQMHMKDDVELMETVEHMNLVEIEGCEREYSLDVGKFNETRGTHGHNSGDEQDES